MMSRFAKNRAKYDPPAVCRKPPYPPLPVPVALEWRILTGTTSYATNGITGGFQLIASTLFIPRPEGGIWDGISYKGTFILEWALFRDPTDERFWASVAFLSGATLIEYCESSPVVPRALDPIDVRFYNWHGDTDFNQIALAVMG